MSFEQWLHIDTQLADQTDTQGTRRNCQKNDTYLPEALEGKCSCKTNSCQPYAVVLQSVPSARQ